MCLLYLMYSSYQSNEADCIFTPILQARKLRLEGLISLPKMEHLASGKTVMDPKSFCLWNPD